MKMEKLNLERNLIYDESSYIDEEQQTIKYKNLEILAELNISGKLKKLYLDGNSNIINWNILKNLSWEETSGF